MPIPSCSRRLRSSTARLRPGWATGLRYEYASYVLMQKELPPVGSEVVTKDGRARVLGLEILAQQVLVQTEDHRRLSVHTSEILSVIRRQPPPPKDAEEELGE